MARRHKKETVNLAAATGLVGLLPSFVFLTLVALTSPSSPFVYKEVIEQGFRVMNSSDFRIFSPIILLGGAFLALFVNLRHSFKIHGGAKTMQVTIAKVSDSGLNMFLALVALGILAILVSYSVTENWSCIIGLATSC